MASHLAPEDEVLGSRPPGLFQMDALRVFGAFRLALVLSFGLSTILFQLARAAGEQSTTQLVHTQLGQTSLPNGQFFDLNAPPGIEPQPLSLTRKNFDGGLLDHIWSQLPLSILDRISRIESLNLGHRTEDKLIDVTFEQLKQFQHKRSSFIVGRAETPFGEKGWTVLFHLRRTRKVERLWGDGEDTGSIMALVEVYPLKEHPYMHLLGFKRAQALGSFNLGQSFSKHHLAQRLLDLFRSVAR